MTDSTLPFVAQWLERPNSKHAVYFADDAGGWSRFSYVELTHQIAAAAAELLEKKVVPGSRVVIMMNPGPKFVAAFFGAWICGAIPCVVAPPAVFETHRHLEHLAKIVELAKPAAFCIDTEFEPTAVAANLRSGVDSVLCRLGESNVAAAITPRSLHTPSAVLQFTSGSTGDPSGITVSWENLDTNIRGLWECLEGHAEDAGVTWLPLYHDMGLVGSFLFCVAHQIDFWWMRPDQFIRNPRRWLECLGARGATLTATPTFGLDYAAKRVRPDTLQGLDFSGWRAAVLGGERIDSRTLRNFQQLLAPRGFKATTFVPAYGMAECTLAASSARVNQTTSMLRLQAGSLKFGHEVSVAATTNLSVEDTDEPESWLVSCGPPIPGGRISIVDETGVDLPPGHLGEIQVVGPSVTSGYFTSAIAKSTRFTPTGLLTGDAGFIHAGELYVVGRMGDSIKLRGRQIYVEALEDRLSELPGIRKGACALLPGTGTDTAPVTLVVESADAPWHDSAVEMLRCTLGNEIAVSVYIGRRNVILRTSSGKPRRREIWLKLQSGELPVRLIS